MAKTKVFVSYDHSEDALYKRLLQAWDANSNFDFEFDALALKGVFPKKHPVSVPAGSTALALPKASLGFVSSGALTMNGSPTAVP